MDESLKLELQRRISRLEAEISDIKKILGQFAPDTAPSGEPGDPMKQAQSNFVSPGTPPPPPEQPAGMSSIPAIFRSTPKPPGSTSRGLPPQMRSGEFWLKIVGIGLTLFGVIFAFKYAIDQGWVNPLVRHLFGLAVGLTLLLFGLRLQGRRPGFAQVLLGGSVGVFYITCFSAFQLFQLISHPVAFAGMVVISAASFWIALRQDQAIFSLIGTAGALGTPFLLYTGSGSVSGLVLYTCLVLISATAVYFFKGWRLLLWLAVVGGWIVLSIAVETGRVYHVGESDVNRWAVQTGLFVSWLLFWLTPIGRRIMTTRELSKLKRGSLGVGDTFLSDATRQLIDRHIHLLSVGSALIALMLTDRLWPHLDQHIFGWATMGAAALYAFLALYLKKSNGPQNLSFTQGTAGTMLFTIALVLLLHNDVLRFVLASEALALCIIAWRLSDARIAGGGHLLFIVVGGDLFLKVTFDSPTAPAFFNWPALVDFWTIACGVAAAFLWNKAIPRRIYLIAPAILLAFWLNRESSGDLLFFLLTVEATAVFALSLRLKDNVFSFFSHFAWAWLAVDLLERLTRARVADAALLSTEAFVNLLPIVLAAGAALLMTCAKERQIYRLVAHLCMLAWLSWEFRPLENGQGFVSVAWGVYGAMLLIYGLRRNVHTVRVVGLGTLMLMVAKLFVVDLASLETIWRVLLFVGFGGVFLALSYYFPKLWKKDLGSKVD